MLCLQGCWWHLFFFPGRPRSPLLRWLVPEVAGTDRAGPDCRTMGDQQVPGEQSPSAAGICTGRALSHAQRGGRRAVSRSCMHLPGASSAPGCPHPQGPPQGGPCHQSGTSASVANPVFPLNPNTTRWGAGNVLLRGRRVALDGGTAQLGGSSVPTLHPSLSSWRGRGARPRTFCTRVRSICRAHRRS